MNFGIQPGQMYTGAGKLVNFGGMNLMNMDPAAAYRNQIQDAMLTDIGRNGTSPSPGMGGLLGMMAPISMSLLGGTQPPQQQMMPPPIPMQQMPYQPLASLLRRR